MPVWSRRGGAAARVAVASAGRGRRVLASHSLHLFEPPGRSAAGEAGAEKTPPPFAGGLGSGDLRGGAGFPPPPGPKRAPARGPQIPTPPDTGSALKGQSP